MNKFRIATRLTLGFGVLLLLAIVAIAYALINARNNAQAMQELMDRPLAKERLVVDWNALLKASVARTSLIARSADSTLATSFAEVIAAGVKKANGTTEKIESLLSSDEEKKLFGEIQQARATYIAVRDEVFKLRKSGKDDLAVIEFEKNFLPAAQHFEAKVAELLAMQRKTIDDTCLAIRRSGERHSQLAIALSVLLLVLGILISYRIAISITAPLKTAVLVAEKVAGGDLTTTINHHAQDEIGGLMRSLGTMNDALRDIVSKVKTGTDAISLAADEISSGNTNLLNRTEQQAKSIVETVIALEQLTSTVKLNADNTHHADSIAGEASEVAIKGGAVVARVVETMHSINASSKKVVDIIDVINDIAFQTNILALNAAVEAARAGDQGRGFAVVATEVRNLAQRAASASTEIRELINDSANKVKAGTHLADEAGGAMDHIAMSINNVKQVIGEINLASKGQRTGIEQVNHAIIEMDNNLQQDSDVVEHAAAAAQRMLTQSGQLASMVNIFNTGN